VVIIPPERARVAGGGKKGHLGAKVCQINLKKKKFGK